MSWTDYEAPTGEVPLGGGKMGVVRGLNIDDLAILLTNHLEPISKAMALYSDSKKDIFTTSNMHSFILECAGQFPVLIAEVISIAADEPTLREKKIGLSVQVAALNEITRLTLEEVGGLGNLLLVLGKQAQKIKGLRGDAEQPANETQSPPSTGVSEKK